MPGKKEAAAPKAKVAGGAPKSTKKSLLLRAVRPSKVHHRKPKTVPLRSSITPGTILILLVGAHRGKRVVFLKQLKSGLLLVSGPLKINNTPLRRVNQAFVIATSTKIDVSKVQIPEHINDAYFKKPVEKTSKADSNIFASSTKSTYVVSDQKKADQKAVDTAILAAIKATKAEKKFLLGYLGTRFSLGKNEYPHNLVF
uniref:60S ribosomal protein L6 n=1 Tax=Panagrellus redivivus TaxID=6233 RepID=A0A7E4VHZ1_PANRE